MQSQILGRDLSYSAPSPEILTFPISSFLVSLRKSAENAPNRVIAAEQKNTVLKETKFAFMAIKYAACCKAVGLRVLITVYFWTFRIAELALLVRMVAKIATPKAPEIFLTRAKIDEATPTSCSGTVEMAALVIGAKKLKQA